MFLKSSILKNLVLLLFFMGYSVNTVAQETTLSVEKIMQDPLWMGYFPSNVSWGTHGETIYFNYNPEKNPSDSLYKIALSDLSSIQKVSISERRKLINRNAVFNKSHTSKAYVDNGKLYLYDVKKRTSTPLIEMGGRIANIKFINDEEIGFSHDSNYFIYNLKNGRLSKLTNIINGDEPKEREKKMSDKDQWVKDENLELLKVVKEREAKQESSRKYREMTAEKEPFKFYIGNQFGTNYNISSDKRYITFNLIKRDWGTSTEVPNYVDVSGYTKDLRARSKVGEENTEYKLAIYNLVKDTVYYVQSEMLPGIKDLPDYVKDYPDKTWEEKARNVIYSEAIFSPERTIAVVNVRSKDNKDRWIANINLEDGTLKTLDRQRDEAWIAGPGIGWSGSTGVMGWLPDSKHIYFQSEATGYSHLYILNVDNGIKKDITPGNFEVFDPFLSADQKSWYFSSSEVSPHERHFYKMPLMGGKRTQLTTMGGNNDVALSPDEKYMAIRFSYSNKPWELYLQKTSSNAKPQQLTDGQSEAFKSYDWRDPKIVWFDATDGAKVPARLYVPEASKKNDAAVVFVHGAGYLQNVHKWWSSYFREYMFHNLLTDLGYTVIDIDYRASAGYGRDWRTGIYRHMGGKDLSDQVDGVRYLIDNYNINPKKVGIYGGSYGGFITLMALFTEPDVFKSGAGLRSVTDWAHYNHGYTSNILNEPVNDPIAYKRSSPIYFAEGLKGNLLMAHGMVDVNVHFQDVVRLSQRLIELEKDNWELAVYPVEDHGFVEPSSWTDEYKRILKLFNETLLED
ncbi:prolyl oligopeptidase family serine peptidase [Aegicerativicinus sediminis]